MRVGLFWGRGGGRLRRWGIAGVILGCVAWFGVARDQGALMGAIARERPALWRALGEDAPLRGRMLAAASAAYQAGGWPAAAPILDQLSYKMILVFASDHALAACNAAWLSARQALLARPQSCARFLDGGSDAFIAARINATAPACDAALAEGAALRRRGVMPRIMSAHDEAAADLLSLSAPHTLAATARAALEGRIEDAPLRCAASLARARNLAALPDGVVAAYLRRQYALGTSPSVAARGAEGLEPTAADVVCPPAGSVLSLRIGGAAVQWHVLGRRGWDCLLRGPQGQFGQWQEQGLPNPLPLLWPLAVGKAVDLVDGQGVRVRVSVRSLEVYRMPIGWIAAYAIDEALPHELVRRFWAPSLGLVVAQSVVPAGSAGGDWEVTGIGGSK